MKPCCSLDIHPHFEESYYFYLQGGRYAKEVQRKLNLLAAYVLLVACLVHFSTLKMEVVRSTETSVKFYQTAWCYVREDSTAMRSSNPNFEEQHCRILSYSWSIMASVLTALSMSVGRPWLASHRITNKSLFALGLLQHYSLVSDSRKVHCLLRGSLFSIILSVVQTLSVMISCRAGCKPARNTSGACCSDSCDCVIEWRCNHFDCWPRM
jgi:hypothetical protein